MDNDYDVQLVGGIDRPFPGYVSSVDKTQVNPGALIRGSKNVIKKITGTYAKRDGLKRRGSPDETMNGVVSADVFSTSVGLTRPIRVLANGKVQVESDIVTPGTYVWYDIYTDASHTRWVFDSWWDNTQKKNIMIGVNGTASEFTWGGGITTLLSTSTQSNAIATAIANASGSGYVVGDMLNVTGGGGAGGIIRVDSLAGSVPLSYSIINPGSGYTAGSARATTGGTGTGATVDITVATRYSITKAGSGSWFASGFRQGQSFLTPPPRDGFAILINGNSYSYTGGGDTTTVYGLTSNPAGEAAGSVIIQAFTQNSSVIASDFLIDFIRVVKNQVCAGSYSSRVIWISADSDCTDFTNSGAHVQGDPDFVILDDNATGIGAKGGEPWVSAGTSDWYKLTLNRSVPVSYTDTDGSIRYVITGVDKRPGARGTAAYAHEFIDMNSNSIIYLSQDQQLRTVGDFTEANGQRYPSLSLGVATDLSNENFSGGALISIGEYFHITAPVSGRDWLYQERQTVGPNGGMSEEKVWHSPQARGLSRVSSIRGVAFGHSSANPQIYQLFNTNQWYDDSPFDSGAAQIPVVAVWRFGYRGAESELIKFDKAYFSGYIAGLGLLGNVYCDYQGATAIIPLKINTDDSPARLFGNSLDPSIGQYSTSSLGIGTALVDDSTSQETLPKFRKICKLPLKECFEYSLEIYSTELDMRAEILHVGANAKKSDRKPISLL